MNAIHFSPHFPQNYYPFSVGLKQAGANGFGIGDAPSETLRPELRMALTEYYRVDSMEDYDVVLRAVGYFTHRYGKMDRIDSFIVCVGQGAWEEPMIADTIRMWDIMQAKGIPCWIDLCGYDVNHDWPWWRKQFTYFLSTLYG
jgi:hypothetical protein